MTIGGDEGYGMVPSQCPAGDWGDATAYWVVRGICVVWLGMVCLTALLTWVIGCQQLWWVRS
eukprot:CAMPEP_0173465598 /NCGR_PEP_ID=MMETSP1357-20121228/71925_1 /TAXON_ID=77926 /ORGANISM="Hemiselmis rufescens, Strain PCC563" /LENGTH=61 /DNA_ID=CAMNT_0014433591 /DNA_START=239 /DNA_END=420 /DNA_ORIENTATION=+